MISLSDIPLADVGEYLDQYGGYLFGFSRKWVINTGFNPVWYCEKTNIATQEHFKMLLDGKGKDASMIKKLLFYYSSYMKNIEGPLYVKSKNCTYSNYRFYDEREYRYVPDLAELAKKKIAPILYERDYNDYKASNKNARINLSIPFTFDDIKIIIVKTDKQVAFLEDKLK